jgi:hypothetical protein
VVEVARADGVGLFPAAICVRSERAVAAVDGHSARSGDGQVEALGVIEINDDDCDGAGAVPNSTRG